MSKETIHRVIERGNIEAIKMWFEKCPADVNATTSVLRKTPLHVLMDEITNYEDEEKSIKIMKVLIDAGADLEMIDYCGKTPLMCLLDMCAFGGHKYLPIAEFLIKAGANIDTVIATSGLATLHLVAWLGDHEMIKFLLSHGADVNIKCLKGRTPLLYAFTAEFICVTVMKNLLKYGADVSVRNEFGRSGLMERLRAGHKRLGMNQETLRYLLDYFDVNEIDPAGNNFLSFSLPFEFTKVILAQIAKLQALDLTVDPRLLQVISSKPDFSDYFKKCTEELKIMKSTKVTDCSITYYQLLRDSCTKLKNHAEDNRVVEGLIDKDNEISQFPIYADLIVEYLFEGISRRNLRNECMKLFIKDLPIFNESPSIIRDILNVLEKNDLKNFCK